MIRIATLLMASLFMVAAMVVAGDAGDTKEKRQSVRGTVEKINYRNNTLTVWVPGCANEARTSYAVINLPILDEVRVGDVVKATLYEGALHELRVLTPKERAPGFLLLCGGEKDSPRKEVNR